MSSDLKARLQQLKELHELGLLTDAEFAEQKRALLAVAMGTAPTTPVAPTGQGGVELPGATHLGSLPQEPTPTPPPRAGGPLSGATHLDPSGGLPSRLGNYQLGSVIGAGGMGTVVRARHVKEGWAKRQGGDVAIKLIHPHIASAPGFEELSLIHI